MPTRKVSERERLTMYARQASDDELETALEILRVEQRARTMKPTARKTEKAAGNKKAVVPGPPNPPKPANDNPVG